MPITMTNDCKTIFSVDMTRASLAGALVGAYSQRTIKGSLLGAGIGLGSYLILWKKIRDNQDQVDHAPPH